MSSNLMDTEIGGEQTQYESQHTTQAPHKKSGGQLGEVSTVTDTTLTREDAARLSERGERTAENIRYGQSISESGMGGITVGQSGEATIAEFGRVEDRIDESARGDGQAERTAAGYGEGNDVGA